MSNLINLLVSRAQEQYVTVPSGLTREQRREWAKEQFPEHKHTCVCHRCRAIRNKAVKDA